LASVPVWAWSQAEQAAAAAKELRGHPGPFKRGLNHAVTRARVLDFHGTGGQLVCPCEGNAREWAGGGPGPPAAVPFEEVWDPVGKLAVACGCRLPFARGDQADPPHPVVVPRHPRGPLSADDFVVLRAIAYLAEMPAAVSGSGGHDATYRAARVVCWGF